jgi:hypothetical protein
MTETIATGSRGPLTLSPSAQSGKPSRPGNPFQSGRIGVRGDPYPFFLSPPPGRSLAPAATGALVTRGRISIGSGKREKALTGEGGGSFAALVLQIPVGQRRSHFRTEGVFLFRHSAAHASRRGSPPPGATAGRGQGGKKNRPCPFALRWRRRGWDLPISTRAAQDAGNYAGCNRLVSTWEMRQKRHAEDGSLAS